jgi:dihydroorotase
MLFRLLPCTVRQRAVGALIMGNLSQPVSNIRLATAYEKQIRLCLPKGSDFQPKLSLYLTDDISPIDVVLGFEAGAWAAVKLYVTSQKGYGGTTNSGHGVKDLLGRYPVFEAMEKHGIPLLGHFESVEDDVDEFDREMIFVSRHLIPLMETFPKLKIVFEHITDSRAAELVATADFNIRATVTAHHLLLNRNDMFKGGMNPGHYCKPVPKREDHRFKIREYVTSGNQRFGAGTDSAPHDLSSKQRCYGCAAGIFTAPLAVELYTSVFEEDGKLENLEAFLSENFLDFYGLEPSSEMMHIVKEPWTPPFSIDNVPVFRGGEVLSWKLL